MEGPLPLQVPAWGHLEGQAVPAQGQGPLGGVRRVLGTPPPQAGSKSRKAGVSGRLPPWPATTACAATPARRGRWAGGLEQKGSVCTGSEPGSLGVEACISDLTVKFCFGQSATFTTRAAFSTGLFGYLRCTLYKGAGSFYE